jgi:hypothetical protein
MPKRHPCLSFPPGAEVVWLAPPPLPNPESFLYFTRHAVPSSFVVHSCAFSGAHVVTVSPPLQHFLLPTSP